MLFLRLLAGHLNRYRSGGLLAHVVAMRTHGSLASRWALALFNATLRIRRYLYLRIVVRVRQLASRAAYAWRSRRGGIAPPVRTRIISLLCPTRGRPGNLHALVGSVAATAAIPGRVEILFYIDDDDGHKDIYVETCRALQRRHRSLRRCVPMVAPPIGISKAWTVLAHESVGDLLVMANDDQVHVDYAWDLTIDRVCDRYPDDIICMYFEDRSHEEIPHEGLPRGNFPMVTRRWFEVVGHFTPGIFSFWCNEVWILDIAQRIGRLQSIPDVRVDHLHYDAYKSPFDETYCRPQAPGTVASSDRDLYISTADERIKAAIKLARAIRAAGRRPIAPAPRQVAVEQRAESERTPLEPHPSSRDPFARNAVAAVEDAPAEHSRRMR